MASFDLNAFYHAAENCMPIDKTEFVRYVCRFDNIILWGAGHLGAAIGKKFTELGIRVTAYWDIRAEQIGALNGIPVKKSFAQEFIADKTLFVFCITNSFVRDRIQKQLFEAGYTHVIVGELVYQGIVCNATSYDDFAECIKSNACDGYTCNRNETFLPKRFAPRKNSTDRIFLRNLTIVINQWCTLKCKYCYSYSNSYKPDQRVNFPLDRILKDIDLFFDAIDGVKFIPLIGGETFLHPGLSAIVKKILEKDNFGILNVTTNGVVKMKKEQFDGMADERVQLVFSNYKACLTEKQNRLYDSNKAFAKSMGVKVIEPNATPTWSIPTSLGDKNYSIDQMKEKRMICMSPLVCKYLKNGRFFPCSIAESLYYLNISDYKGDYIELDKATDSADLHSKIHRLLQKEYFRSCGHCDGLCGQTGLATKAGEQGYHDFLSD